MTDQDRPDDESRFDDPADAWVRDLLASARVTGRVPDDVAARLDETLASLRTDRVVEAVGAAVDHEPDADDRAPVVPLRRRLAPLLAAAAAVVVVAGGAVGVSRLGSDHGSQGSAGAGTADRAESGASGAGPQTPLAQRSGGASAASALPHLTRAAFARDAAAVMRTFSTDVRGSSAAVPGTSAAPTPSSGDTSTSDGAAQPQAAEKGVAPPVTATPGAKALAAPAAACPGPQAAGAVTVPATLDGAPVALVFRPPTAAAQRVEAWSCDGVTLLASASVPR